MKSYKIGKLRVPTVIFIKKFIDGVKILAFNNASDDSGRVELEQS
jgi:hypothetical protein